MTTLPPTLTPDERERFAMWLENEAYAEELLADQLAKIPGMGPGVNFKRSDAAALRRVAQRLRETETIDV